METVEVGDVEVEDGTVEGADDVEAPGRHWE